MFNWFSRPHNSQNLYPPFLLFVYKLVYNAKHRITLVMGINSLSVLPVGVVPPVDDEHYPSGGQQQVAVINQ
jgi:hypothetical protein